MKLVERLRILARSLAQDVLGESPTPEALVAGGDADSRELAAALERAEAGVDSLRLELARAVTRCERVAQARQETLQRAQSLDTAVNHALQQGREAEAASLLQRANQAQARLAELDDLQRSAEELTGQIRATVAEQQARLHELRGHYQVLADRADAAQSLETLQRAQRELTRQTETLRAAIQSREEQITRREDLLAARQDWNR